jgi:hypothetical protein
MGLDAARQVIAETAETKYAHGLPGFRKRRVYQGSPQKTGKMSFLRHGRSTDPAFGQGKKTNGCRHFSDVDGTWRTVDKPVNNRTYP